MIRLFSSDLDGTLVGAPAATGRFRRTWDNLRAGNRPLLVYNSGRLIDDMKDLVATTGLPIPDVLIGGVGTQWCDHAGALSAFEPEGWDRAHVDSVMTPIAGIAIQPARFQNPFKSSWYLADATRTTLDEIRHRLAMRGLKARIVYSSNRDLDVLPTDCGKGEMLARLCAVRQIPLASVVVAGDTGNDASMFALPGVRGIVVGNALPELRDAATASGNPVFQARLPEADGVIEGLRHFGVAAPAATLFSAPA